MAFWLSSSMLMVRSWDSNVSAATSVSGAALLWSFLRSGDSVPDSAFACTAFFTWPTLS